MLLIKVVLCIHNTDIARKIYLLLYTFEFLSNQITFLNDCYYFTLFISLPLEAIEIWNNFFSQSTQYLPCEKAVSYLAHSQYPYLLYIDLIFLGQVL